MKLQICFDMPNVEEALSIASQVVEYADILEVGTILLYAHGIKAIEQFRVSFPEKTILVDSKIIANPKDSVDLFAKANAEWITVMGGTEKDIVYSACNRAQEKNIKVMLDLLDANSIGQSALDAKTLGANSIKFPYGLVDKESMTFLDKWEMVRGNTDLPIFVSGSIKREVIEEVIAVKPDGIIIGRAITQAENPQEEAEYFKSLIKQVD